MHQKYLYIKTCVLVSLGMFLTLAAQGTCPFIKYSVHGRIVLPDSVEASSIKVYLFLEGARRTSDYPPRSGNADFSPVTADGVFEITSFYSTYDRDRSKGKKEERCVRVAASGDLIVIGENVYAERVQVEFKGGRAKIRKELEALADAGVIPLALLE